MQVTINGKARTLNTPLTITELLRDMNIEGKVAVEINREILPRSRFVEHRVRDGDSLEIVRAIGGG